MKNKILLVLTLCVLGLFWDDLALRVAQLEYDLKDLSSRRLRLSNVEKKTEKIAVLENQLKAIEQRLLLINPLAANNNLTTQRLAILEKLVASTVLTDQGVDVFRSSQHVDRVHATGIGSHPSHRYGNWGGHVYFRIGRILPDNVGRALLKFDEINPQLFRGKRILSAAVYIKQMLNESFVEDDAALQESIDLYAVKKKWEEGSHLRGQAGKGEVTWMAARTDQEDWAVAGCSDPTQDFDPLLLGTTGPVVSGDATQWIPIVLNADGLARLVDQNWSNNGFLLRLRDESKSNTAIMFESDEGVAENMPYIEIYYQDEKSPQELR